MKKLYTLLLLLIISSCSSGRDAECIDSWFKCLKGQGMHEYTNGETYNGEWKDDMKNGQGTYTYANGETLTGEFRGNYIKTRKLSKSDEADCYEERFRKVRKINTIYKSVKSQYRGLPSSYSYLTQNLTEDYLEDIRNLDELYELCKGGFTFERDMLNTHENSF